MDGVKYTAELPAPGLRDRPNMTRNPGHVVLGNRVVAITEDLDLADKIVAALNKDSK